ELWHQLPQTAGAKSIALDRFPEARAEWQNSGAVERFELIQEVITALRNLRSDMKADPKKKLAAQFSSSDAAVRQLIEANRDGIHRLAILSELTVSAERLAETGGGLRSTARVDVRMAFDEAGAANCGTWRLCKEIDKLEAAIASKDRQLGNQTFRSRAPENIIRTMEEGLATQRIELQKLAARLKQLA